MGPISQQRRKSQQLESVWKRKAEARKHWSRFVVASNTPENKDVCSDFASTANYYSTLWSAQTVNGPTQRHLHALSHHAILFSVESYFLTMKWNVLTSLFETVKHPKHTGHASFDVKSAIKLHFIWMTTIAVVNQRAFIQSDPEFQCQTWIPSHYVKTSGI